MSRILIVEDEDAIRENLAEILEFSGYQTAQAPDGASALSVIETVQPDLVLCDVMMPNKDGFELLEELRRHAEFFDVPFVLLTARSDPKDMRRGMSLGADDYLIKPFEIHELLESVALRLKMSRRAARLDSKEGFQLV